MGKKYRSGFERLSRQWTDTAERYAVALKAVRENFKGFTKSAGYDAMKLSENQRHQIRRYYNLLTEYTEGQPVYKMPPSELPKRIKSGGEKNIDAVKRAAQMHQGRKRSKYIFIKYDGENIPSVGIRNGSPVFINKNIGYEKETIEINKIALATDPIGTIKSLEPLTKGASFYRIIAGRHEFGNAASLNIIAKNIVALQQKYDTGNHSWENWLHGVIAYYGLSFNDFIAHETKVKADFRARVDRENKKARSKRK